MIDDNKGQYTLPDGRMAMLQRGDTTADSVNQGLYMYGDGSITLLRVWLNPLDMVAETIIGEEDAKFLEAVGAIFRPRGLIMLPGGRIWTDCDMAERGLPVEHIAEMDGTGETYRISDKLGWKVANG